MKKIILLTDFSDNAKEAAEYAIAMFGYEIVEYTLLNVYTEPYSSMDMMISISDLFKDQSEQGVKKEYEYLLNKYSSDLLNIKQQSLYGDLSDIVNKIVASENIDFVVMGTKGASGIEKMVVGRNTVDVIKKVKCPILAIPEKTIFKHPFCIAFATDYGDIKQHLLDPLAELAIQYQSELMIINIHEKGELISAEQAVKGFELNHLLDQIPQHFYGIEYKNIAEGLNHFIHEHKVDMLTLVTRQHDFFDQLFHYSVTEQISMLVEIPVLILHE